MGRMGPASPAVLANENSTMKISWKFISIGVAAGAGVVQTLWFADGAPSVRLVAAAVFLIAVPGVYLGKKWWGLLALVEICLMFLYAICTIAPDYDVPAIERVSVSTAFLIGRIALLSTYSLVMLWALATKLRVTYFSDQRES
jgi:hypothetical protein